MGVVAYEESDGKMWWRLPEAQPDLMTSEERAAIQQEGRSTLDKPVFYGRCEDAEQ
jgi:hypothetical protein